MANNSNGLNQTITQVTSQPGSTNADAASQISAITEQLTQLTTVSQMQADAVTQNTDAVIDNTATRTTTTSSGTSTADTAASIASSVLGGGLGLIPLISGLVGLFGGGSANTPPPLATYTAPDSISFQGQESPSANTIGWTASQGSQGGTPAAASTPQITVQVNAMDSQSFMDHSQDIARAVRSAMLSANSLNDVVNDL